SQPLACACPRPIMLRKSLLSTLFGRGAGPNGRRRGARVALVVQYRAFLNTDPPGLAEVWNEAFTGRGAAQLRNSAPLERHAFAKPFFDPNGLIVALDDDVRVGFAHAGFGPNNAETSISHAAGVTCIIGVRPQYRHRGIGSELLNRCEDYL